MSKILTVATAMVVLTASWVGAGNFEVMAQAGAVRPATPLYIQPGSVAKAQFPSAMRTTSDVELDSPAPVAEPAAASAEPTVTPRSAIAFRERSSRPMAPPPAITGSSKDFGPAQFAASGEELSDLEADLEKEIVISPPPSKGDDGEKVEKKAKSAPESRPVIDAKSGADTKSAKKKKAAPQVKEMTPSEYDRLATKPIVKVRPITQNPWCYPAGSHGNRAVPPAAERVQRPTEPRNVAGYQPMAPTQHSHRDGRVVRPPAADRIVRDGVTVRLAPTPGAEAYQQPIEEDSSDSDLLSAAAEIIGMPFAFISSFF